MPPLEASSSEVPPSAKASKLSTTSSTEQLEQLCRSAVEVVNSGDVDHWSAEADNLLDHLEEDWEARLDNFPFSLSLDDLLALWGNVCTSGGRLQLEILHMSTKVRDNGKSASVYMHLRTQGLSKAMSNYVFCELKWKWREETWICGSLLGMRKPCSDSGIFC